MVYKISKSKEQSRVITTVEPTTHTDSIITEIYESNFRVLGWSEEDFSKWMESCVVMHFHAEELNKIERKYSDVIDFNLRASVLFKKIQKESV